MRDWRLLLNSMKPLENRIFFLSAGLWIITSACLLLGRGDRGGYDWAFINSITFPIIVAVVRDIYIGMVVTTFFNALLFGAIIAVLVHAFRNRKQH
jgi:hypothetical protein